MRGRRQDKGQDPAWQAERTRTGAPLTGRDAPNPQAQSRLCSELTPVCTAPRDVSRGFWRNSRDL